MDLKKFRPRVNTGPIAPRFEQLSDSVRRVWLERQRRIDLARKLDDIVDLLLPSYLGISREVIDKVSTHLPLTTIRTYLSQDPDWGSLAQRLDRDGGELTRFDTNSHRDYRRESRLEFLDRAKSYGPDDDRWRRWELLFGLSTVNALRDIPLEPSDQPPIEAIYRLVCEKTQHVLPIRDRTYIYWYYPFSHPRHQGLNFRVKPKPDEV